MRAVEKFHASDAFAVEPRQVQPASLMFSPESLFRIQLAMRDEAMCSQLSPLPRFAT